MRWLQPAAYCFVSTHLMSTTTTTITTYCLWSVMRIRPSCRLQRHSTQLINLIFPDPLLSCFGMGSAVSPQLLHPNGGKINKYLVIGLVVAMSISELVLFGFDVWPTLFFTHTHKKKNIIEMRITVYIYTYYLKFFKGM